MIKRIVKNKVSMVDKTPQRNIHDNNHSVAIEEEAAEWFTLLNTGENTCENTSKNTGEISHEQQAAFRQWLQQSDQHQKAYQEMQAIWDDLLAVPAEVFDADVPQIASEDLPAKNKRGQGFFSEAKAYLQNLFTPSYRGVVVGLSMTFCVAALLLYGFNPVSSTPLRYMTEKSEIREFQLEDGSIITLSADSEVEVMMSKSHRQVSLLKGRAYFDIASQIDKNGSKVPFKVVAKSLRVKVVGTEFDVHLFNKQAAVTVAEGVVEVGAATSNDQLKLVQGQQVVAIGNRLEQLGKVKGVDTSEIVQWRKGRLTYRDATLGEVISDARRFHKGSITIGDQKLSSLRVTTSFRVDQVPEMTEMLEQILPVSVYLEPKNRIVILPRHDY